MELPPSYPPPDSANPTHLVNDPLKTKPPLFLLETAMIAVFFGLLADGPPPGVNEAHYLTKARHYWDPSFCAGDLFLESADAHLVFYWLFGWVTVLVNLETAAWIGRIVAWLLLASGWQRLSATLLPHRGLSVLTAIAFVLLQRSTHMAGEWVVGGIEAKCFAYGLVFHALACVSRRQWLHVWPLLGAATAFHVLVGGWSMVAAAVAFCFDREQRDFGKNALSLGAGLALAAFGLIPALQLNAETAPDVARQAADIYVYKRLPHHLSFSKFKTEFLARMGASMVVFAAAWSWMYSRHDRGPWARVYWFIGGAVAICLVGIVIDLSLSPSIRGALLLRYYWYRLADVMVPLGLCLSGFYFLVHLPAPMLRRLFLALTSAGVMWLCGQTMIQNWSRPLPGAFFQLRKFVKDEDRLQEEYQQWQELCLWMQENTPTDARVLAPRGQQTLKWYAFRGEVSNWKDVPQDAGEVVRWYDRQRALFPRDAKRLGLTYWQDDDLLAFMERYGAQLLLLDRDKSKRTPNPEKLERIYPIEADPNVAFELYRPAQLKSESSAAGP